MRPIDFGDAARREREQEAELRRAAFAQQCREAGWAVPPPDPAKEALRRQCVRPLTPGLLLADLLGPVALACLSELVRGEILLALTVPTRDPLLRQALREFIRDEYIRLRAEELEEEYEIARAHDGPPGSGPAPWEGQE